MFKIFCFLICAIFLLQDVRLIGSYPENFQTKLKDYLVLTHTFPQTIFSTKKSEEKYFDLDLLSNDPKFQTPNKHLNIEEYSTESLDEILQCTNNSHLQDALKKNAKVVKDNGSHQTFILEGAYLRPERKLIAIHNTENKTIDIYSTAAERKDRYLLQQIRLHPTLSMASFFLDWDPDKQDTKNQEKEDRLLIFYNAKTNDRQVVAAISIYNSDTPQWALLSAGAKVLVLKNGQMPIEHSPAYSIWDMKFFEDVNKKDVDPEGIYGLCDTDIPKQFAYYKPVTIFATSTLVLITLYYKFLYYCQHKKAS